MANTPVVPTELSLPTGRWDLDLDKQNKDCGNCCSIFCLNVLGCNCCVLGNIAENLNHPYYLHCCCFGAPAPLLEAYMLRMELMRVRAIPLQPCCGCQGECGEFCRLSLCFMCSMCQMNHEAKLIKEERAAGGGGVQGVTAQAMARG